MEIGLRKTSTIFTGLPYRVQCLTRPAAGGAGGQGTPNRHNENVIVAEVHRLLHDAAAYKAMANAVNSVRR
jgi:hypothetical protein